MTDKKWKCVTYTVLGKPRPMRWFDRWNPWALRRKVAEQDEIIQECVRYRLEAERQIAEHFKRHSENRKCIEKLESMLMCKEKECELEKECAKHNFRKADQMLSEIHAAIGLLQDIAKE